ncbi:MAG: TrbG/VirB9 family P-type conjugative transfer protein, partial [Acidobacteria bacterium]|nr:TrbG/VirB9 family P-type conjugative transfer protein [Acidobacteriota bacterium]
MRRILMGWVVVGMAVGALAGEPGKDDGRLPSPEDLRAAEEAALENSMFRAWGPEGPPEELEPPPGPPEEGGVRDAYERFLEEEIAPVVGVPEGKVYPFGGEVPEVVALPGWTTDVSLEPGEEIDGYYFGDPEGWVSSEAVEGGPEGRVHILLRPTFFGKRTNLVVVTSRRTYHLRLQVPEREKAAGNEVRFQSSVSWWYPQEWRREGRRRARAVAAQEEAQRLAAAEDSRFTSVAVERLHHNYRRVEPHKKKERLGFRPRAVFDDGERT